MEARVVTNVTQAVQSRFFIAIDMLISQGALPGLQTFCTDYDLHKAKYSNLRTAMRNPEHGTKYKFIDIDAMVYLARDYKISCEWLLLGRGGMFNK